MHKSALSYFYWPIALTIAGLVAGIWYGGPTAAVLVSVLIVLEISLSFDNAVVNATVLRNWDEKWRNVFLFWGILVAVFGMRLVFPILIVSVAGSVDPISVVDMAFNDPDAYGAKLASMEHVVSGFGGAFLAMVGLAFFVDSEKDTHWLGPIERILTGAGQIEGVQAAIVMMGILSVSCFVPMEHAPAFVFSGIVGLVTFILSKGLGTVLGGGGGNGVVRQGVMGFLYLEVLDASFSFDGVIGAFALTNSLLLIMIGLGVGAFYVREVTIYLVDRGTLEQYRYLEHGAFWAILVLSGVMFAKPAGIHLPEWFVGLSGAALIGIAVAASAMANRRDAVPEKA